MLLQRVFRLIGLDEDLTGYGAAEAVILGDELEGDGLGGGLGVVIQEEGRPG